MAKQFHRYGKEVPFTRAIRMKTKIIVVITLLLVLLWMITIVYPMTKLSPSVLRHSLITMVIGILAATACSLVGVFLVLRKMALIGDAISHAVLPGIAIAFFITQSRNIGPMLVGAALLGVITVVLIEALYRTRRVHEDASIGVVFPALFAIGVILISKFASNVHIDTDCVLEGEIASGFLDDLIIWGRVVGPKPIWMLGAVCFINLTLVALFWKELKLSTFDPQLAAALGFSPLLIQYTLMGAVSVTTVASFESVGAILVVALLVVPAATGYLLTDRLWLMTVLSVGFGVLAAVTGCSLGQTYNVSIAGSMAATSGVLFCLVWLLSPSHGMLSRALTRLELRAQFSGELLISHLRKKDSGIHREEVSTQFRWSKWFSDVVLRQMDRKGLIRFGNEGTVFLTELGEAIPPARAEHPWS